MDRIIARKFVKWDVPPLESLADSRGYQLRIKINNGGKLTREEKDWLAWQIRSCNGLGIKRGGYFFDFSDVLQGFVVKQYDQWTEHYAPDRTSLRKALYGRIAKIVSID